MLLSRLLFIAIWDLGLVLGWLLEFRNYCWILDFSERYIIINCYGFKLSIKIEFYLVQAYIALLLSDEGASEYLVRLLYDKLYSCYEGLIAKICAFLYVKCFKSLAFFAK